MNGMVNQQCNDEGLRELALFAGAGGGILGGHLLGWKTIAAVEYNAYARSVLLARQNDGTLPTFPIWDDVCTFDGKPWRGLVDVVSGGFPCQDISEAGKGEGIAAARSGLWKQMLRIVGEVRPSFVLVENSPRLPSRGIGTVLGDLAGIGYDAQFGSLSARQLGAPHKRKRTWIVATNTNLRRAQWGEQQPSRKQATRAIHWEAEPGICRVDDGVANRVDRLKAIGNGQVPIVAATAWEILNA